MYTYDVTIGRNVGDVPMPTLFWRTFQQDVAIALRKRGEDIESAGWAYDLDQWTGVTMWQGAPEESAHFQLRTEIAIDDFGLEGLREDLYSSAVKQQQEAIALAIGQCELVTNVLATLALQARTRTPALINLDQD